MKTKEEQKIMKTVKKEDEAFSELQLSDKKNKHL